MPMMNALHKRTYFPRPTPEDPGSHPVVVMRYSTHSRAARVRPERVAYIAETIATWSADHDIHHWIMDRCADGVTTDAGVFVDPDVLLELLDVLMEVQRTRQAWMGSRRPRVGAHAYWADIEATIRALADEMHDLGRTDWTTYVYHAR